EVGGDLYDYFIQGEKLYFCIGDVSGKGIPASLVMATAMNLFRVVGRQELPPVEIARQINETLAEGNEQMMFVTMFIGALDLADGGLDFCNCGHNPPVLLSRGGEAKFLSCKANTCIGVVPGYAFEGEHVELKDTPLFLYTDGVTEAEDPEHEQFGEGRLVAALSGRYEGVEAVARGLAEKVKEHVGGALASDDLTMVCLEWQGGHN
ncbi:MAG: serine/threonine-protein phosphatase, partial [Bacteroidales bacterium]|nr:serine/threonine-protein phosphatase [Bacteroidales bacterium]